MSQSTVPLDPSAPQPDEFNPEAPEILSLQRRTLSALFVSAIFGRASMSAGFVVAGLLAADILGSPRWAGAATAAITAGTAVSASHLSSRMRRRGRRSGLWIGYLIAVAGSLVAVVGGDSRLIIVYLLGLLLFGVGQGATNLARYAAADLAPARNKGKAISYVVFASTVGAVTGPLAVEPAKRVAESLGLESRVGPFVVTAGLFLLAGLVLQVWLRPDPLEVNGGLAVASTTTDVDKAGGGFAEGVAALRSDPLGLLAVVGLVVSQAVMVMVMAMTPLHMDAHGHQDSAVGWVLSVHTAGMFAFAPLAGWFSDRFGPIRSIMIGAVLLIASTIITALAGDATIGMMFAGLFLLGLGWSFGMIASSALLTTVLDGPEQVAAQGAADVATSLVSGTGALASGLVYDMAGYHILSMVGIVASGVMLVAAFVPFRLGSGRAAPA